MVFESTFKDAVAPDAKYADQLGNFYWSQLDKYSERTLFVDYASGRQWTGKQIKEKAAQVASYLKNVAKLPAESHCMIFYANHDTAHFISLGLIFAGSSTCAWHVADHQRDKQHIANSVEPEIVFCDSSILNQCLEIRQESAKKFTICLVNDQPSDFERLTEEQRQYVFGYQRDIMSHQVDDMQELPVQVSPKHAAYILMTSGSTGLPKAVIRSHRNSLYVCHSLEGEAGRRLWDLNETTVLAAFQELDHGTGTFCIKMALSKGFKIIIMDSAWINGYSVDPLLDAIDRYKVTDFILAYSFLNKMIGTCLEPGSDLLNRYNLSSVRNIVNAGGPIVSKELCDQFEQRFDGNLSIRSGFGMTEAGFVALEPRAKHERAPASVGLQFPFCELKLLDTETGAEIEEFERPGELHVRSPQVSPGYLGKGLAEQQRAVFLSDGFYRTGDVCMLTKEQHLAIRGRLREVICLTDGWKVLPYEIESLVLEMPEVAEVSVLGIPDEDLPGNHKPRAYVVLKPESRGQITEQDIQQFVASRSCQPKHLRGGVKLLDELPRITLGKVDKKRLRQMDGF